MASTSEHAAARAPLDGREPDGYGTRLISGETGFNSQAAYQFYRAVQDAPQLGCRMHLHPARDASVPG